MKQTIFGYTSAARDIHLAQEAETQQRAQQIAILFNDACAQCNLQHAVFFLPVDIVQVWKDGNPTFYSLEVIHAFTQPNLTRQW